MSAYTPNMPDPGAVLRSVLEAFKEVPYPGDDRLVVPHCSECVELQASFAKVRRDGAWLERPLDFFDPLRLNSAELTDEAYDYYFPLLAAAVALHYLECDMLSDTIVWRFDPYFAEGVVTVPEKRFDVADKRLGALSPDQRQAVIALFRYLESAHPEDCWVERTVKNLENGRVVRL